MEHLLQTLIIYIPDAIRYACHVYRQNVSYEEIEDICQDVIALLIEDDYRRLRTFKAESSVKTWVYTVARHHVRRRLQRKRDVETPYPEHLASRPLIVMPIQEISILLRERQEALREAIAALPDRSRELFKFSIEGLSDAEISRLTGIKADTVRKCRYDLIKRLRRLFEERGW